MDTHFNFKGNRLPYNVVNFNNTAERVVEIPIAFDFLANLKDKTKLCEIGNVLSNYEVRPENTIGVRSRRIIDKYEIGLGITNMDLMDMLPEDKYSAVISVSTVEHIGQEWENNKVINRDREAPLKAIAKIYDLLQTSGSALITVPFGKLIDGRWYIQFSAEYLALLTSKYGIPEKAVAVSFLKRIIDRQRRWVEVEANTLDGIEYTAPMPWANAIAVIELTKLPDSFILNLDVPPTRFIYHTEMNTFDFGLAAYHRILIETAAMIGQKIAAGKSFSQIKEEGLPPEWKPWIPNVLTDRWLASIYYSLTCDTVIST